MMKHRFLFYCLALFMATSALADHNAIRLDSLILALPADWEAHVVRTGFSRYGVPEMFQVRLELPTVEFEHQFMPGDKRKVRPTLTLCFYAPLTEKQYADFQKQVEAEVTATDQPPPRMLLLIRTENYWVFSPQSPDRFRHPKEEEIYRHVKAFLSINRKE